jgi:hypothetical protein
MSALEQDVLAWYVYRCLSSADVWAPNLHLDLHAGSMCFQALTAPGWLHGTICMQPAPHNVKYDRNTIYILF